MKVIKFDKYYSKLKNKTFTTIRDDYKNIKLGSIVECRVASKNGREDIIFHARLRKIKVQSFWLIDNEILAKDLDLHYDPVEMYVCLDDAVDAMREYYPDFKGDDNVFVYCFERE
ncbi:hypothetical protein [Methanobrevibacter sp.]|uniref:hypothetical protein n=1 Tax=Methanobrevibacter sp. TaxID=66852 RepID=UPI002617259D|nr:hypothetical protein [uncultured Methanobrevibacter sp.]